MKDEPILFQFLDPLTGERGQVFTDPAAMRAAINEKYPEDPTVIIPVKRRPLGARR